MRLNMYLTVHRVVSNQAERGINGAIYRHYIDRRDPIWISPNLEEISSNNLGTQIKCRTDIKPGANTVECFLDIAFPDDFSKKELKSALSRFRNSICSTRTKTTLGSVAIDFAVSLDGQGKIHENFDQLSEAAIDLFQNRNQLQAPPGPPLEIIETGNSEYRFFELSEESKRRLRTTFGSVARIDRVRVPFHVDREFQILYGDVYPFVLEWATAKSRSELSKFGGVIILRNGESVWEWIPHSAPS